MHQPQCADVCTYANTTKYITIVCNTNLVRQYNLNTDLLSLGLEKLSCKAIRSPSSPIVFQLKEMI